MVKMTVLAFSITSLIVVMPAIALFGSTNIGALASAAVSIFSSPKVSADEYDYGQCTYWAALRRLQIGEPLPNTWGNAITWAKRAAAENYLVNHTPSYAAIMQDPNAPGGLGHVAFVESVNTQSGTWTISEMNRVGWDEIDYRTLPMSAAEVYNFIHQQL